MNEKPDPNTSQGPPNPKETTNPEPVWTYRGYQLRPGEFTTAMVHFFRAEISRANVWRQRLDATTNWAVVTTGAVLSFAFSQPAGHHSVILLNMLLVTMFLVIEARRYRYYELWSSRVRLMETDFFASMLVPPFQPSPDWAESLAESLLQPHFSISQWEAFGRRLRRNYLWIYAILGLAWLAKLWLHPVTAASTFSLMTRASIGGIHGGIILLGLFVFYALLGLIALVTVGLHEASGEVLPHFGVTPEGLSKPGLEGTRLRRWEAWFRHSTKRQQLLAFVITDRAQEVADHVLRELMRGMTAIAGTGMYTGASHIVLICALTVTEAAHFKAIVSTADPNAFVIVSPAKEIFGKGFSPLKVES